MDNLGSFECLLAWPHWNSVQAIALIVTLIFIIWYTRSTHKIMKFQEEEIGLKKRPVVTTKIERDIKINSTGKFFCRTLVENKSNVHAKYRVEAIISINEKPGKLYQYSYYDGERIWQLQAGTCFAGILNVDDFSPEKDTASIFFKSWAVNYQEKDDALMDDKNRNPNTKWDWDPKRSAWIPDAAPEELDDI